MSLSDESCPSLLDLVVDDDLFEACGVAGDERKVQHLARIDVRGGDFDGGIIDLAATGSILVEDDLRARRLTGGLDAGQLPQRIGHRAHRRVGHISVEPDKMTG